MKNAFAYDNAEVFFMQNERLGNGFFQIIKGVALALAFSVLSAVVLASILQTTSLPDKVIYPVNQTLKAVCITVGALACVRGEKGFIKGGAIALLFTALSYLAFSAIGGDYSLSWMIAVEVFISLMTGVLSGSIAVNLRRNG